MATLAQLDVILDLKGDAKFKRRLFASIAAVTAAGVAFDKLVTRGGKIVPVMSAFTNLAGDQAAALTKLRAATNGLVSDFDLMQQANTALTLGSAQSVDQFAEMATVAQKLGRALGVDATFALNSLNTGIARQSRLFLDNIGIIISVEEANESYARTLGKQASQLTDLERREAFRIATMEEARAAVANLGETTGNAADAWGRLKIQVGNTADVLATATANSNTLKQGLDAITLALGGDFEAAMAAYVQFLTGGGAGSGQMTGFTGPPTNIPKQTIDEVAEAAESAVGPLGAVAHGIMAVNDGQTEFVARTGEAIQVLDVYALAAGNAADEVDNLAKAQSAMSSGMGLLGGIGRMLGMGIPGLGMLGGAVSAFRGGAGLFGLFGGEKPPGKAAGGPVESGRAYLVGEQGPELMVPSSNGTIIPNHGMSINVSMSKPRSRIEMHRDQEWLTELRRSLGTLSERGMSFA